MIDQNQKPLKKILMKTLVLLQRKRAHVSDELTIAQKQDLLDFFADHPLFYNQTTKDFKNRSKKDPLLDDKGKELGMSGECQVYSNTKTVKKI